MAIADMDRYRAMIDTPTQILPFYYNAPAENSSGTKVMSMWKSSGRPGAGTTPTTSVATDSSTTGALGQIDGGSNALRIVQVQAHMFGSPSGALLVICDRLNHSGGLDATSTSTQTTNLPTASLTRYTDGVGVFAGLEIYSNIGSTATTVTASYTNQASSSGQTTAAVPFGGNDNRNQTRMVILPLATGDTGIKSVESVTLVATTGTAGNFGVTLFKPLIAIPIVSGHHSSTGSGIGEETTIDPIITGASLCPEVVDGACLFGLVFYMGAPPALPAYGGQISLAVE